MAILIRPVREQLEHDRVIRLLQAKYKRKFDVVANVGDEKLASIKVGPAVLFPDLVLTSLQPPRRVVGVVEVETGESVNHLEALAQWANFSKSKAAFHLYVPSGSFDIARRLCDDMQVVCAEFWTYMLIGDQLRFTLARKTDVPEPAGRAAAKTPAKAAGGKKAVAAKAVAKAARPAKPAKGARAAKPARAAKASPKGKPAPKGKAQSKAARPKPPPRAALKSPAKDAARGGKTRTAKRR